MTCVQCVEVFSLSTMYNLLMVAFVGTIVRDQPVDKSPGSPLEQCMEALYMNMYMHYKEFVLSRYNMYIPRKCRERVFLE